MKVFLNFHSLECSISFNEGNFPQINFPLIAMHFDSPTHNHHEAVKWFSMSFSAHTRVNFCGWFVFTASLHSRWFGTVFFIVVNMLVMPKSSSLSRADAFPTCLSPVTVIRWHFFLASRKGYDIETSRDSSTIRQRRRARRKCLHLHHHLDLKIQQKRKEWTNYFHLACFFLCAMMMSQVMSEK